MTRYKALAKLAKKDPFHRHLTNVRHAVRRWEQEIGRRVLVKGRALSGQTEDQMLESDWTSFVAWEDNQSNGGR